LEKLIAKGSCEKSDGIWPCRKCDRMTLHREGKCLYCGNQEKEEEEGNGENQNTHTI
jgi:hypothetical protein